MSASLRIKIHRCLVAILVVTMFILAGARGYTVNGWAGVISYSANALLGFTCGVVLMFSLELGYHLLKRGR